MTPAQLGRTTAAARAPGATVHTQRRLEAALGGPPGRWVTPGHQSRESQITDSRGDGRYMYVFNSVPLVSDNIHTQKTVIADASAM